MKKLRLISVVMLSLAVASLAGAQPWGGWQGSGGWGMKSGYHRWYDTTKEERVEGEVISVEQVTPQRRMGAGIALKIKTGTGTHLVHLGPQWFIERQDINIVAGDRVEVTGARAARSGEEVFLAAEVTKGEYVLKLRDDDGYPVWAGWRRGARGMRGKGSGGRGMAGGTCRPYDAGKEEMVNGEVVAVEQVAPRRSMGTGIALKLNSGKNPVFVVLGPHWYIERQDMTIAAGDTVDVKGVKTVRRGKEIFLAAEVTKDGEVLKLRDETGFPLWAGWRRSRKVH